MTDKEKFEIAVDALNNLKVAFEDVKDVAYKDSEKSYPDVEKGAYFSEKYEAYTYALCFIQQKLNYLNKLN